IGKRQELRARSCELPYSPSSSTDTAPDCALSCSVSRSRKCFGERTLRASSAGIDAAASRKKSPVHQGMLQLRWTMQILPQSQTSGGLKAMARLEGSARLETHSRPAASAKREALFAIELGISAEHSSSSQPL